MSAKSVSSFDSIEGRKPKGYTSTGQPYIRLKGGMVQCRRCRNVWDGLAQCQHPWEGEDSDGDDFTMEYEK